jgi:hypothetical protein
MLKLIPILLLVVHNFIFSTAIAANSTKNSKDGAKKFPIALTCVSDPKLQQARSLELQQLHAADQALRVSKNGEPIDFDKIDRNKMKKQDLAHRKRVGEIFGEGCLKSAADYLAAALIYQHGDVPDHYYQTYIWATRTIKLGINEAEVKSAKAMAALAIDRYLVSFGNKQLFGSQFYMAQLKDQCWCIEQVEPSFPDALRKEYLGQSLLERSRDSFAMFNKGKNCPNVECSKTLKPTPKGTVLGLW